MRLKHNHGSLLQVNPDVLNLLLDYCRFHRAPGRSDKVSLTFLQTLAGAISTDQRFRGLKLLCLMNVKPACCITCIACSVTACLNKA